MELLSDAIDSYGMNLNHFSDVQGHSFISQYSTCRYFKNA